jgi:hypothetical protein
VLRFNFPLTPSLNDRSEKGKVRMDLPLFGQSKIPKIVLTEGQPISKQIVPSVPDFLPFA